MTAKDVIAANAGFIRVEDGIIHISSSGYIFCNGVKAEKALDALVQATERQVRKEAQPLVTIIHAFLNGIDTLNRHDEEFQDVMGPICSRARAALAEWEKA